MTLQECYDIMGGDYTGILRRFRTESMISRFLKKLPADPNYAMLEEALDKQDYETAFRAAHTLKGLALNLGLTELADSSATLSDLLRSGTPGDGYQEVYAQVQEQYRRAVDAIQNLT